MGATSNESKQRWNSSNYAQVKVSVPKDMYDAFKAKCRADEMSVASKISQFMAAETGRDRAAKPPRDPYGTRPKRRKELEAEICRLTTMMEAEREYMENIPENLQNSQRYEAADQAVTAFEEALSALEEAY